MLISAEWEGPIAFIALHAAPKRRLAVVDREATGGGLRQGGVRRVDRPLPRRTTRAYPRTTRKLFSLGEDKVENCRGRKLLRRAEEELKRLADAAFKAQVVDSPVGSV